MIQNKFERYEIKYMLTQPQKQLILRAMAPYMKLDKYGFVTIHNIYFDTHNYQLIRDSIEKPIYKEKLRVRSYSQATPESTVFVELKKKYDGIVYKRRIAMPEKEAMDWLCRGVHCKDNSQISQEIDYFIQFYKTIQPKLVLSYDREAYYSLDKSDFRITFDNNILCREEDLSLTSPAYGEPVIENDKVLMEIKCSGSIPVWLSELLSQEEIFKTSFSKYGTAYKNIIFPQKKGLFYV